MSIYSALADMDDADDIRELLRDIVSNAELAAIEHRWRVAQLLVQDKTYREIIGETGLSSAIVSRVKRALFVDGSGALRRAVSKDTGTLRA